MAPKVKSTNPRAYLLKGDDDFKKNQDLEKLVSWLIAPAFEDFDLEQFDGSTATSEKLIAGLGIPPFGSRQRVVLVKHANKMDPEEQGKLAGQLVKTPESGCLILVTPAPEKVDGRIRKGSEVTGELSKAVRRVGEVREFGGGTNREKQTQAREFAQSLFADAQKKIDMQALSLFLQRVGTDFSTIKTEAEKLLAYSADSPKVTVQDVSNITSETPEEKVFKLVDAVSAKNRAEGLRLLDEIFATSDSPEADAPKTLATLARQFRLIWQMKILSAAGVRSFNKNSVPDKIKELLPSDPNILDVLGRQSWMADRLSKQAKPFTCSELTRCFNSIARADQMLKGIEGAIEEPKMIMELLILDLAKPVKQR